MNAALPRVLETEAMDAEEEAAEYNSMDHGAVNESFVDDLIAAGCVSGDVLDLGTGTALIPVAFCRRVEDCRILAVDLSIAMLDLARYNIEVAGFIDRITLRHVDCKELPYDNASFDAVISNSIVHHVAEPQRVLREALRVVRPTGIVFFRDLIRPVSESELEQLVERYTAGESSFQQAMFRDSLRASLTLAEVRELVEELGHDPATVQATSDRHWTWAMRLHG